MTVPVGFKLLVSDSPFVNCVGPFYLKEEADVIVMGLAVEPKHCNSKGYVHGGLVATMADLVLGRCVGIANIPAEVIEKYHLDGTVPDTKSLPSIVTASLTIDYLGRASVGDWLEMRAEVQKSGRLLSFASARMDCNGQQVTHTTGIYRHISR